MLINSRPQKRRVARRVFRGARLEVVDDFRLRERRRERQRFAKTKFLRNTLEKLFDGLNADRCEHLLALGRALGQIAHQADCSRVFVAMYASYALASMSDAISFGFDSLTRISHAAP